MDRQFHILRGASCRDVASSLVVAAVFNEHKREDEATEWFWNYHCLNVFLLALMSKGAVLKSILERTHLYEFDYLTS